MFPRQDEQGEVPQWTRLGQFAGVEMTFVRELLQDEGIAFREQSLVAPDGVEMGELWVTSLQHERAAALVAEAQSDAEAAAYRETAAEASERENAASAAAQAALAEARANAAATRRALRQEARHAARDASRRSKHVPHEHEQARVLVHSQADRAVLVIGAALALLVTFFVTMTIVGDRYGTHAPTPGRTGPPQTCVSSRFSGVTCH